MDFHWGLGHGVVKFIGGVKGAHGNAEGAVDGVAPAVGTEGIVKGEAGADDGAAEERHWGTPGERVGGDGVLRGVCCEQHLPWVQ